MKNLIENDKLVLKYYQSEGTDAIAITDENQLDKVWSYSVLCPFDFDETRESDGPWSERTNLPIGRFEKIRLWISPRPDDISEDDYDAQISNIKLVIITKKLIHRDTGGNETDVTRPNNIVNGPYPLSDESRLSESEWVLKEFTYEVDGFVNSGLGYIESEVDHSLNYTVSVNTKVTFKITNPDGVGILGGEQQNEEPIVVSLGETDNADFPKICFYVNTEGYIIPHHTDYNRSYSISYLYASYKHRPHQFTHCGENPGGVQPCGDEDQSVCGECPWPFYDCYISHEKGIWLGLDVRDWWGSMLKSANQYISPEVRPNTLQNTFDNQLAFANTYDWVRYYGSKLDKHYSFILELSMQEEHQPQGDGSLLALPHRMVLNLAGEITADSTGILRFPGYAKLLELSAASLHHNYEGAVLDNALQFNMEMDAGNVHSTFAIAFVLLDDVDAFNVDVYNWVFVSEDGTSTTNEINGFTIDQTSGEITSEGITSEFSTDKLVVGINCDTWTSDIPVEQGGEFVFVEGIVIGPDTTSSWPESIRYNTGYAIMSETPVWVGADEFPDKNISPLQNLFFVKDHDDYFADNVGKSVVVGGKADLSLHEDGDTGIFLELERIRSTYYVSVWPTPVEQSTSLTIPIQGTVKLSDNDLPEYALPNSPDPVDITAPNVVELNFSSHGPESFKVEYGVYTKVISGFNNGFVYHNLAGRWGCSECGSAEDMGQQSGSFGCIDGHFHSFDGVVSPKAIMDATSSTIWTQSGSQWRQRSDTHWQTRNTYPTGVEKIFSHHKVCENGSRSYSGWYEEEKYSYLRELGISTEDVDPDFFNRSLSCEDRGSVDICARDLDWRLAGSCPAAFTDKDYTDVYSNVEYADPLYGFPTDNGCWRNCCKDYIASGWSSSEIPGCQSFWDYWYVDYSPTAINESLSGSEDPSDLLRNVYDRYDECKLTTHMRVDYREIVKHGDNSHEIFKNPPSIEMDDGYPPEVMVFPANHTNYSVLFTTNPLECNIATGSSRNYVDRNGLPYDDYIGTEKSWCSDCPDEEDGEYEVCGENGVTYTNACVAMCTDPDVKIVDWDNACPEPTPAPTEEPPTDPCSPATGTSPQDGIHTHIRVISPELSGRWMPTRPDDVFLIHDFAGPDYWGVNIGEENGGPRVQVVYQYSDDDGNPTYEELIILPLVPDDQDVKWVLLNGSCEYEPNVPPPEPPEPTCDWESWYTCEAQSICLSGDFTILNGQYDATSHGISGRPAFRHANGSEFRLTSDCKWNLYDSEGDLVYWSTNTDSLFPPGHVGETCPTDSLSAWNFNWSDGTSIGGWSHDQRLKRDLGPCNPTTPTPGPGITIVSVDVNEQVENNVTVRVSRTEVHRWRFELNTWELSQTGFVADEDGDNITFTALPGQHTIMVYAMDEEMQDIPDVTDTESFDVPIFESKYADLADEVVSYLYECPDVGSTWGCGENVSFTEGRLRGQDDIINLSSICMDNGDRCMFGTHSLSELITTHLFVERADSPNAVYIPEKLHIDSELLGTSPVWFKGFVIPKQDDLGNPYDTISMTPEGISVWNKVTETYKDHTETGTTTGPCHVYSAQEIQSVFYDKDAGDWLEIGLKFVGLPNQGENIDCVVSEWTDWGSCVSDSGCGEGEQGRSRTIITPPNADGSVCPQLTETRSCTGSPCPVECVVSEWSEWGVCSKSCNDGVNPGTHTRTRVIEVHPAYGAGECPPLSETRNCNETVPCPIDPVVGDWSEWGPCSKECGTGAQKRTRVLITASQFGGSPNPPLEESRSCNEQCCPVDCVTSDYGEWSTCRDADGLTVFCGGGTQSRTRTILTAAQCGGTCPTLQETRSCKEEPCPVDCEVSDWSDWSICYDPADESHEVTCGGGIRKRERTVTVTPQGAGKKCPALTDAEQCNTQPCPTPCVGGWTPWSHCIAAACESSHGIQSREFKVSQPAQSGGAACEHDDGDVETRECSPFSCTSGCVDKPISKCKWYARTGMETEDSFCIKIPGTGGSHELRGKGRDPWMKEGKDGVGEKMVIGENAKHDYFRLEGYAPCIDPDDNICQNSNHFFIIWFNQVMNITDVNAEIYANWWATGRRWWKNAYHGNYTVSSDNKYRETEKGYSPMVGPQDGSPAWTRQSEYLDDLVLPGNWVSNIILIEPESSICSSSCNISEGVFHRDTPLYDPELMRDTDHYCDIPYDMSSPLQEDRWNLISKRQTISSIYTDVFKDLVTDTGPNPYTHENFMQYRNENFLPETPGWFAQKASFSTQTNQGECCDVNGKFGFPAKGIMFQLNAMPTPTYTSCLWDPTTLDYECDMANRAYGAITHAVRTIEGLPFIKGFAESDGEDVTEPYDLMQTHSPTCDVTSRTLMASGKIGRMFLPFGVETHQILPTHNTFPPLI